MGAISENPDQPQSAVSTEELAEEIDASDDSDIESVMTSDDTRVSWLLEVALNSVESVL